jgi:hypothetical protein
MVLQQEPRWEDQQLARYLLGELSDDEADRIDECSISDETLAWRLREVEDELVDAYVSGRLNGDDLQRFKWFYLSSERRRDRVRFAEALQHTASRQTDSRPERSPRAVISGWRWLFDRSVPLAWGVGLAAALMLVGCGALLQQDVNLRQALHSMQADSATLERRTQELLRQLAAQRSEAARAAQDLAQARASLEDAISAAPTSSHESRRTLPPVSLLLLPQARSVGSPPTLTLPRAATQVALQLQLEFDDFRGYRIAIEDPGASRVIWRSNRMPAHVGRGRPSLSVLVPAGVLSPKLYAVELLGVSANGDAEVVGSYSFRVQRP